MNYITLVQETRKRVGIQGSGPSAVTVDGYESQIVAAVKDSWETIQNYRPKWKWMRAEKSFLMTIGKSTYTLSEIFGPSYRHKIWLEDTLYFMKDSKNIPLTYVDFDTFRLRYLNTPPNGVLNEFTIRPYDNALVFTPPDVAYTVTACYQKSPQILTNDSDTPEMPTYFHNLIMYGALENYGYSISYHDVGQFYGIKYAKLMSDLLRDQNPREKLKVRGIA